MKKNHKKSSGRIAGNSPRRNWSLAWYFAIPAVMLIALTAPWQRTVRNFFAPYLTLSNTAGNTVAEQTLKMRSRSQLAAEVMKLREQNVKLITKVNELERFKSENLQLRSMLELKAPHGYKYTACSITLRDPWMWDSAFTIDRGSDDGMKVGMAVIVPEPGSQERVILLGRIESVSKHTSRVITVLNPEMRISAVLPESDNAVGIINAGLFEPASGGTAAIGFLPANRTFTLNQPIYTTEFEAGIPGKLWLGTLESIEPSTLPYDNRLYRRGVMRPAANLESLRTVLVVQVDNQN
ncbi:MAG: rod shape-determining protein MreC [Lentisphaerae bacterium]|nr:rod shape-determining protein MreC [Lentisphaerota bacterium]